MGFSFTGNEPVTGDAVFKMGGVEVMRISAATGKITLNDTHVGQITPWNGKRSKMPVGKIGADGQEESHSVYPGLHAALLAGTFETTDEATWQADPTQRGKFVIVSSTGKMRMPDWNGKSAGSLGAVTVRGDGTLSFGEVGRIQRDQFQAHHRTAIASSVRYNNFTAGTGAVNAAQADGVNSDSGGRSTAGYIADGANGAPRFGSETRMLNVTVVWVIQAYGSVANPTALDAAQLAIDLAASNARIAALETTVGKKFIIEHRLAANVAGGATSAGVNIRPLNLVIANDIAGASLDIANSQITLPAGTYDVQGYSAVFATGGNQAFLTPLADATTFLAIGTSGEAYTSTGADAGRSIVYGRFTLAETTTLVLRHWTLNARTINGFGVASNSGVPNVHAALTFQRVS